jgi:LacI family transcriptional regulator
MPNFGNKPMRMVLIVLGLNEKSGRDRLSGIFRYINSGVRWRIKLLQDSSDLTPQILATANGVISSMVKTDAAFKLLFDSPVPAALIEFSDEFFPRRARRTVFVNNENEDVGRIGAQHLLSLGSFRAFSFVPDQMNKAWSRYREKAFCRMIKEKKQDYIPFCPACGLNGADDGRLLAKWLKDLPKPAAVMAANDFRALQIQDACRVAQLRIPEEVALLGVDNDELLCELSNPTLSSIQPDHEEEGFQAALELDRILRSHKSSPFKSIRCAVKQIVERESTVPVAPAAHLVREALVFINQYACQGISAADVVKHLGVSHRLADLRFRQYQGETMAGAIQNRRLEEVKRQLSSTALPIRKIAALAGFKNENYLAHLFTSRFGLSPCAWRKTQCAS